MRLTRRGWGAAHAGLLLVGLGLVAARPVLLVGGAVVGAWLLAWQFRFVRAVNRVVDALSVEQRPERDRVAAGREITCELSVELPSPSPLALTVESRPPAATSVRADGDRQIEIDVGERRARTSYRASWPHAGRVAFEASALTARDPLGLFAAAAAVGTTPTVTVEPRAPRDVHVGAGGEPVAAAYGEHAVGARGAGLDPAELREYVPGDAAGRIDWKATARLAAPYVREFEAETDRRMALVVDHRASTGDGRLGETKLDHLREVALALVASARAADDPLSCVTVGDGGLTGRFGPEADRRQHARVRAHLASLEPTDGPGSVPPTGAHTSATASSPGDRLADDGSAFATTLRPYVRAAGGVVDRVEGDPLFAAVRTSGEHRRGSVRTVLLADDTDPHGLQRTVELARRGADRVLVYLTPTVLFEPGGLGDLEAAYDRYVRFEDRRRALARLDRVEAYEVAPGDRLEAVLGAGRRRRRVGGGG